MGCLPSFFSNCPTGPSCGIGYGTGTIALNQKMPSLSLSMIHRPSGPVRSACCTSYFPLESVSQISILTPSRGLPSMSLTEQSTRRGSPLSSCDIREPWDMVSASWVWKGPRTVPSVLLGGLGWSMLSTSRERPRMSERRMNSWQVLLIMPVSIARSAVSCKLVLNCLPAEHLYKYVPSSSGTEYLPSILASTVVSRAQSHADVRLVFREYI